MLACTVAAMLLLQYTAGSAEVPHCTNADELYSLVRVSAREGAPGCMLFAEAATCKGNGERPVVQAGWKQKITRADVHPYQGQVQNTLVWLNTE
jgi:hypothetical protein